MFYFSFACRSRCNVKHNLYDLMPTIRLPVRIIDYDLPNKQTQKNVCTLLDKQMVSNLIYLFLKILIFFVLGNYF